MVAPIAVADAALTGVEQTVIFVAVLVLIGFVFWLLWEPPYQTARTCIVCGHIWADTGPLPGPVCDECLSLSLRDSRGRRRPQLGALNLGEVELDLPEVAAPPPMRRSTKPVRRGRLGDR